MRLSFVSYALGVLGLLVLCVRLELLPPAPPNTEKPPELPSIENSQSQDASEAQSSDQEKPAPAFSLSPDQISVLQRARGLPLAFDIEMPKSARTNEAFVIRASKIRVAGSLNDVPLSATDSATLSNVYELLRSRDCFSLEMQMPGMQFSPQGFLAPGRRDDLGDYEEWNFWSDKEGSYRGTFYVEDTCLRTQPYLNPKSSQITVQVKSPWIERDAAVKAILDFLGGGFTLQALIVWIRKKRTAQP
jgi:hypothetical protein